MSHLFFMLLAIPALGFCGTFFLKRESTLSAWVSSVTTGYFVLVLGTLAYWITLGFPKVHHEGWVLAQLDDYRLSLNLYFDAYSAEMLALSAVVFGMTVRFCRIYLHRDPGFRRFFMVLFVFLFGMTLLTLAGGLDILFVGWEFVGLASFLLIGFYRERAQPVRNAMKVYAIYRVCDLGFLLGAWLAVLFFSHPPEFIFMDTQQYHQMIRETSPWIVFMLTAFVYLAAAGKSAQFPFSYWLPRAMEGPTPSSAIFYGALSIHAGVFLLIRTHALWEHSIVSRVFLAAMGLVTAVVSTVIGRVQSNMKGQIAYAASAQVGMMMIELSLGWFHLVAFHMASHAFLRCYQILVSPSAVAYLLRIQASAFSGASAMDWSVERFFPRTLRNMAYVWALQEGKMESLIRAVAWSPLRRGATALYKIFPRGGFETLLFVVVLASFWGGDVYRAQQLLLSSVAIALMSLRAIARKDSWHHCWDDLGLVMLAFSATLYAISRHMTPLLWCVSSFLPFWLLGKYALRIPSDATLKKIPGHYWGYGHRHPGKALAMLISVLGISGFPIGTGFILEDYALHLAAHAGVHVAMIIAFSYVLVGIAGMRAYTHVFWGTRGSHSLVD